MGLEINTAHCTDTEYRPVARGIEGAAQRPHTHLVPQIDKTKLWGVRASVCTYIVIHQTCDIQEFALNQPLP